MENSLDAQKSSHTVRAVVLPPVLDPCCSCRKFWFDPHDDRAIFCDKRQEMRVTDVGTPGTQGRKPLIVAPDLVADFTAMPFPDESFHLVVFDPPHMEKLGETGHSYLSAVRWRYRCAKYLS